MESKNKIYKLVLPDSGEEPSEVSFGLLQVFPADSEFLQGVLKGEELKESGVVGKTIEQIREENGLPSRIEQLRDAQEEWMRQGHG